MSKSSYRNDGYYQRKYNFENLLDNAINAKTLTGEWVQKRIVSRDESRMTAVQRKHHQWLGGWKSWNGGD